MKRLSQANALINLSLCLLVFIWVIGWFFTMSGLDKSTPFSFSALRFLIAALVMHLLIFLGARHARYTLQEWFFILLVGIFQTTMMFSLASYGMIEVGLSKAAILIYSTPVWTSLLGWYFLSERLSIFKFFGLAFACLGILLISIPSFFYGSGIGVLLLIGSSLSWSVSSVILKSRLARKDMICITAWQMTFGSIGLIALAFYVDGQIVFEVGFEGLFALIYVSLGASVVGFTLWFYIVSRVDLIRSSMASLFVPVSVLIIQEVRAGERLDLILVVASVFIVLGLIMVIIGTQVGKKSGDR
ncbi:DMT family transporter [Pseudomonas kitaguniensis]|uniref:DMT family transporter n=1 Tax=Pseudomonas kitaguniensis TaxID=2607908 RepID=UPI003BA203B7